MESIGLMWFMHFKLRSTKVALSILRENPLQALIGGIMPIHNTPLGSFGTPLQDNIMSKALDGTLGYAFGPRMMLRAPMLNPIAQLLAKI